MEVAAVVGVGPDDRGEAVASGKLGSLPVGKWEEVLGVGDLDDVDQVDDFMDLVAEAAAEKAVERVRYDNEAALLADGLGGAADGSTRRNAVAEEQADQVTVGCGNLLADDNAEVGSCSSESTG